MKLMQQYKAIMYNFKDTGWKLGLMVKENQHSYEIVLTHHNYITTAVTLKEHIAMYYVYEYCLSPHELGIITLGDNQK